jgi:hypothetical protein
MAGAIGVFEQKFRQLFITLRKAGIALANADQTVHTISGVFT